MNFTKTLSEKLSHRHLLNHAFYQAWNDGCIPLETLRVYAGQYHHHVSAFPRYLSATHSNCPSLAARQVLLENLNDEEGGPENHPELWLRFAEGLGATRDQVASDVALERTQKLVDTFMRHSKSSYAEGLGALYAYERQVPEVAAFKIEALKAHYGIGDERALSFFEVHRKADVYHTQAIEKLLEELTPSEKLKAEAAALESASALWGFLDEINEHPSMRA